MLKINNNPAVIAVVFAAAIAATIFFVAVPLVADIEAIGTRIGLWREKIAGYDLRIAAAREFMLFEKRQKSDLDKVEGVFADSRMSLDLISSLEAAAKISVVDVEFLPPVPQNPRNDWPFVKVEMNVSGGVPAILQFVEMLENSRYLMEIENIDIRLDKIESAAGSAGFSTLSEAHILLKVYAKL